MRGKRNEIRLYLIVATAGVAFTVVCSLIGVFYPHSRWDHLLFYLAGAGISSLGVSTFFLFPNKICEKGVSYI